MMEEDEQTAAYCALELLNHRQLIDLWGLLGIEFSDEYPASYFHDIDKDQLIVPILADTTYAKLKVAFKDLGLPDTLN